MSHLGICTTCRGSRQILVLDNSRVLGGIGEIRPTYAPCPDCAPLVIDYFGTGRDAGDHSFLSNFYPSPIWWNGLRCATVEHAYQAAKTTDPIQQNQIVDAISPRVAKQLGRRCQMRPDWDEIKLVVMSALLARKFDNPVFARWLLATGESKLIEGNTWHDQFWGDCRCGRPACMRTGLNALGRELEGVRTLLTLEYGKADPDAL